MRTILITGASGGIAQALVNLLPDDQLILLGRDAAKLDQLYANHPQKKVYQLNLADTAEIEAVWEKIQQEVGAIDILINNAGYGLYDDFEKFSAQQVEEMFRVNTFATMTLCRLIGGQMKAAQAGHIINIVSMSGHIATAQSSVYSATKFALIGFSDAMRLELATHKVAVTTVNPGPVATKFFDLADPDGSYQASVKRYTLQPEQVAERIVRAMRTKSREINTPFVLATANKFYHLFPRLSDFLTRTLFNFK